jgi:hypothetical protein
MATVEKPRYPINFIMKRRKLVTSRYFDHQIEVDPTETSYSNPFPLCLVVMKPELIGTHELTQPKGLEGINYSRGWNGAPIAVANPHDDHLIEELGPGIHVVESGLEYGQFGVLDGHHRREVAERDGLLRVITQLFPLCSPNIIISTWLENFTPLTPDEVAR